jgi:hypothetical protein
MHSGTFHAIVTLCQPIPADVADALAHALLYDGKQRFTTLTTPMARITAERLIRRLGRASFVLMRSERGPAPTTAIMPSSPG